MFALSPPPIPHPFPRTFSVPLSPLNPNARPLTTPSARSKNMGTDASSPAHKTVSSSRRQPKFPSLSRDAQKEREKRKIAFLDKVRKRSEEQRWDARWERELREEFFARQRVWESEQRKRAAEWDARPEDEEELRGFDEDEVANYFLSQQEQEVEAMVESLAEQPSSWDEQRHREEREASDYGSDDEEYEQLLMAIAREAEQTEQGQQEFQSEDNEMDTSMG